MQKSIIFLYPSNEQSNMKLRKQFHVTQHQKNKILKIKVNLALYTKNYKPLSKKIKEELNKWKDISRS